MADVTRTVEIQVDTLDAVKSLDKLNDELKDNQKETEDSTKQSKKFGKQLEDTSQSTSIMTDKLDDMTGGFLGTVKSIGQTVKGLKSLKIALAATGIGLVLAAVSGLVAAFKNLQGPMSLVEDALAGVQAAFDQALKSLDLFGKAFLLFLEGNYVAALAVAKVAIDDIGKAYQEGSELSKGQREFELRQARTLLLLSEQERQIEQLKLVAEDQTKTQTTRIEAANKAFELQEARVKTLINLERERTANARKQFELSTETDQDEIDFLNLQTEGNERIATLEGQLVELNNSRNAILKEIQSTEQQRLQTSQQQVTVTGKLTLEEELFNEALADQLELEEELARVEESRAKVTDEAIEDQNNLSQAIGTTTNAATGLLDVFQGKVKGKDIFKTVLKTLTGVLGIIFPGAGSAISGIGGLIGGLFADGGMINGPSHKQGGVWINAEGGEGVINKRSMSIPWVRDLASQLNEIGGGVKFEDGGIVPTLTAQESQLQSINASLQEQRIVLPIPDLTTEATKVQVVEDRTTL
jgi:hypothetical protein